MRCLKKVILHCVHFGNAKMTVIKGVRIARLVLWGVSLRDLSGVSVFHIDYIETAKKVMCCGPVCCTLFTQVLYAFV